jgi:hypothetical protein
MTLAHNVLPDLKLEIRDPNEWHLCLSDSGCEVAYFKGSSVVLLTQLPARPAHKTTDSHGFVCFCFGYSRQDIADDFDRQGVSRIRDKIVEACRDDTCDCERLNPAGRCCLGDVT